MLSAVLFVPSAPLLLPALAGPGAPDTEPVRSAVVSAFVGETAGVDGWVAIGATDEPGSGRMLAPATRGTFRRYGVDAEVTLDRAETGAELANSMPLSMLVVGWLRECGDVDRVAPIVIGCDTPSEQCALIGAELAAEIADDESRLGVLVVGDGAFALTPKSPGGGRRESAVILQKEIDDALARPEPRRLAALTPSECAAEGVGGRVAWQVAAALCAGHDWTAQLDYAAAPFGVGYTVARWVPAAVAEPGGPRS